MKLQSDSPAHIRTTCIYHITYRDTLTSQTFTTYVVQRSSIDFLPAVVTLFETLFHDTIVTAIRQIGPAYILTQPHPLKELTPK